ncbi:MAG: universal stress protein [Flavobacteriales bacterium]|nr:universal stress protein [Flavobacteriales bacterium]
MEGPTYRILHPTDLTTASHAAFVHALRLALAKRAKITLLHASDGDEAPEWGEFPGVRETLHQWGLLPAEAHHRDVAGLGIAVRKLISSFSDPVEACLSHLADHPADLIVLAHGTGRPVGTVSTPLSRRSGLPTLFLPAGSKGFVEALTGKVRLARVLLPVASSPSPEGAVAQLAELLSALEVEAEITVLHVGEGDVLPSLTLPEGKGLRWVTRTLQGEVIPTLVAASQGHDLVVMPTDGRSGLVEMLRGSHTERVLRSVRCPLLALPVQ